MLVHLFTTLIAFTLLVSALTGCATYITREPDLGPPSSYPLRFSISELEIGVEFPKNLEGKISYGTNPFKSIGLLVINMKLKNNGERSHFLLQRRNISFVTEEGFKYIPLTREEAVAATSGWTGLYGFLFFPNIGEGYRRWGLDETLLVGPTQEISGYLFFYVGDEYDKVRGGYLQVSPTRIQLVENFDFSFLLDKTRESSKK